MIVHITNQETGKDILKNGLNFKNGDRHLLNILEERQDHIFLVDIPDKIKNRKKILGLCNYIAFNQVIVQDKEAFTVLLIDKEGIHISLKLEEKEWGEYPAQFQIKLKKQSRISPYYISHYSTITASKKDSEKLQNQITAKVQEDLEIREISGKEVFSGNQEILFSTEANATESSYMNREHIGEIIKELLMV